MIRTLVLIAVSGFLLSVVCLSVAVGMAGPDFIERGMWGWRDHSWWGRHVQSDFNWSWDDHATSESRTLPFTGEALEVDVPADVAFTQADGPARLVVHGAPDAIGHVVLQDGHLRWDGPGYHADGLKIELTAPKVTQFTLNGSGDLQIDDYRQDTLSVKLNGSSDVTARGTVHTVDLQISGDGDADLSGLAADGAQVRISGSGEAKVAPKTWAKLDVSGSGDITLTTHPPHQETHVSGSGRVEQEDGSSSAQADDGGDQT